VREDFAPISAVSRDAVVGTVQRHSGFWLRPGGVLAALVFAVALSCTTTTLKRPIDVSGRVAEDVLGDAPDLAITVRLARAMSDSLYGPILRCAIARGTGATAAADLAAQAESVDIFAKDDAPTLEQTSLVLVASGVPSFAPEGYKQDDGRPEWAAARPLRSGVAEHAPVASGHGTWLFVLPDHTLIFARGRAVERARSYLGRFATAPAPLEAEPNTLAMAWALGPVVVRMGGELGREADGVTSAVFAVPPGPDGTMVVRMQAEGERRAVAIEQRVRDWGVRDVCPLCRALARAVHVERSGALVRVDVRAPTGELDELRQLACSVGAKPEHVATPLPADFTQPPLVPPRVAFVGGKDVTFAWTPTEQKTGGPLLVLGMYDERSKLVRRMDATGGVWRLQDDNALDIEIEHVLAGNRIVVHDTTYAKHDDEALTLFDAATGKRTGGIVVQARGRLCASPTEPLVFVEDDEPARQTMVHTDTAAFEKAPRPAWCPPRPKTGPCAQPATIASCLGVDSAPRVDDLAPYYVLALGDDAVVLGERAEGGRHVAMVAGFDLAKKAVRWTRILPAASKDVADEGSPRIADVAYGTLLVEYDEWHGKWKLLALDVTTGKTKWENPLRVPAYFAVSPTRIWFADIEPRPGEKPDLVTNLHALDLETGKPL
jgi:hypothetical protein